MKGIWPLVLLVSGWATSGSAEYIYFPELARAVIAGDAQAFQQVLAKADSTPPGEQLEELAELSSRFVRLAPADFLRGQSHSSTCFGVGFMGPHYVDDPVAVAREVMLRKEALESVKDPVLASTRERCLGELAGS